LATTTALSDVASEVSRTLGIRVDPIPLSSSLSNNQMQYQSSYKRENLSHSL
jgi:hypothetical protein